MFRHRFDIGTMLHVLELNVKNLAFAQQKMRNIAQMRTVFFEELNTPQIADSVNELCLKNRSVIHLP